MTLWDLIDTQWNVNTFAFKVPKSNERDLIDTQWNVNLLLTFDVSISNGFNRYIVECKYTGTDIETVTQNGFNRYIVECK